MAEDSVAVMGVGVALACVTASHLTKNPMWDGLGSVLVSDDRQHNEHA